MLTPTFKPKTCAHCGTSFTPLRSMQKVCATLKCAKGYALAQKAKAKKVLRERKAALKTIPDLLKETQIVFNKYIRERDKDKPCICCGKPLAIEGVGGAFDCGHYRSVGSASHLRFNELNAHGQRKVCNRYGAGRAVDYRIGLIARLGIEAVDRLESDNTPHKWTREELIGIRDLYRQKLKDLRSKE